MRGVVLAALLAGALNFLGAAGAYEASAQSVVRAVRVDDSGTVVVDPVLQMQWQPAGRLASSPLVSGATRVAVQLNLGAFVGQSGQIYMTLPRSSGTTVRATWQTGGTLLPGSMLTGERALIYSGPISGPLLRDLIDITLEADGGRLQRPEALSFGFELEVIS